MLQFIVLGQIPGTNIQLSFIWIFLLLTLVVLITAYLLNPMLIHHIVYSEPAKPQKTNNKKHTRRQIA